MSSTNRPQYKLEDITNIFSLKRFLVLLLIIIAVFGIGSSYYFYGKYQETKINLNLESQKEASQLIASVGRLIELPKDEIPTVATVLDKEKLKNQPFFKMGENGDHLLVYKTAMIAILYRSSINKIINAGSIAAANQPENLLQNIPVDVPTSTSIRIAYYNGTEAIGLAKQAEKIIQKKYPNYQTTAVTNAFKKDYKKNLVVDLTGKYTKEASSIALLLDGKTGILPQGEAMPDADILIISGQ